MWVSSSAENGGQSLFIIVLIVLVAEASGNHTRLVERLCKPEEPAAAAHPLGGGE